MTQAGETDHDKELQKAFAEFTESLRHNAHGDNAPKLSAPEIVVAEPRRPAAPQPKIDTRPVLGSLEPHVEKSVALAPVKKPAASGEGRRRGLLYLSAAIIVTGLGALGWTLTHGARPTDTTGEPATAAVAPETPAATEAATTPEAPATPATAETPAPDAPQTAAAPATTPAAAPEQPPVAAAQPATEKAALTQTKAAEPAAPPPAAAAQAPVKTQPVKPAAKEATTTPPAAPEQADAAATAKPKPAAKPKVVKAKPKPAPTQSASRPAAATPAPEPAPVAEAAPPPPPPPQSDGALGFVKRTVNSVGSTISNIGRGAAGN